MCKKHFWHNSRNTGFIASKLNMLTVWLKINIALPHYVFCFVIVAAACEACEVNCELSFSFIYELSRTIFSILAEHRPSKPLKIHRVNLPIFESIDKQQTPPKRLGQKCPENVFSLRCRHETIFTIRKPSHFAPLRFQPFFLIRSMSFVARYQWGALTLFIDKI